MALRGLGLLTLGALVLAGCVSPPPAEFQGAFVEPPGGALPPLAVVPDVVTGLEPVGQVEFGGGNEIAFRGNYAFVATHNNGKHIIDISDPRAPVEVATVPCHGTGIETVMVGQRLLVTLSSQSNDQCEGAAAKGGIRLVDATDPLNPVVLGQVPLKFGSHTHTAYGDTGIVYNSAYDFPNPLSHHRAEIIDVSDPAAPKVVGELMFPPTSSSMGCHDILAEPELHRAICAGISETMIWDTTDPRKPVIKDTLTDPAISIHHSAATAREGKLLLVGDEYAGVLAPACHPVAKAPTGAIWFFEIDGYSFGKRLGHVPPPTGDPGKACTAHNFNVVDGRDLAVGGFYSGGTLLIDFSDPTAPKVLQHVRLPGTSSWATYHYRGAVFSGDGGRGFDAFVLV